MRVVPYGGGSTVTGAELFRGNRRGGVQVGAGADLAVFDAATVSDRGTYAQPNQTATGMRYVIVNGTAVIRDGELVREALAGRPIRRPVTR